MSELPDSWVTAPLGDLLSAIVGGGTPSKANPDYFQGSIPFMTVKDMHERFITDTQDHITEQALESSASSLIPADTLVVASRMSLGKIARPGIPVAINQDLKALFLHEEIDKTYIEYAWRAKESQIQAMGTGTTVKGIRLEDIRGLEIPVAPSAEQTRIADQLDKLLARIQSCNDRLDTIPALLKQFRHAALAAATSGALIESDNPGANWPETTIGSITVDLRYGTSKKCNYSSVGTGVLRIPNIADQGRIDIGDLKRAEFDSREISKLALREGDLLVIRSNGSVDLVGKTSLVTVAESGLLFAGYLMRLRVDPAQALPAFVQLCLSAPAQRQYIERTAKSTSGVNNLNAEELRALRLRLPSLTEQVEIVRRVEALFKLADRIEARYAAARTQAQRLSPLLLAKAFRGELVPQDPNDEPASALLERVATEREKVAAQARPRKPTAGRKHVHAPRENASMTKSRQDDDVQGQPYLARHLRMIGGTAPAEALFKASELPVADFYKQLAWEVANGHLRDGKTVLELGDAA